MLKKYEEDDIYTELMEYLKLLLSYYYYTKVLSDTCFTAMAHLYSASS